MNYPEDFPGAPYYARIRTGFVIHNDDLAAIVFYRQPGCITPSFNLLALFNPPASFACTLTVEGFAVFDQAADQNSLPKHAKTLGLGAVPIALVSWTELKTAMAGNVLTMPELEALSSLRPLYATAFRETLLPAGETEGKP